MMNETDATEPRKDRHLVLIASRGEAAPWPRRDRPSAWILKADWPAEAPRATNVSRPRAVANEDGHDRITRLIARLTAFLKMRRAADSGLRTSGHA
jgi:hypothetical protein